MKKLFAAMAASVMLLSVTGCSKEALDNVSQFIEASGRDYGGTYTAKMGEEQKNSFFTTIVNSVELKDEVNGYVPDEGYEFVCVNITVKNIFGEQIIMGCGDFEIAWGDDEDERDVPAYAEDLSADLYPDQFYLEKNEKFTGTVFFTVPVDRDGDLKFIYEELYDDDFEGSTYIIELGDPD